MGRKKRITFRSMVIICEGSETEPPYLRDMIADCMPHRLFEKIDVFPEEKKINQTGKSNKRVRKQQNKPVCSYINKIEENPEDYEHFKEDPVRWVREAYLYREDGYTDLWAVYDKEGHTGHKRAREYAEKWGVGIGVSSYCIEQWILLHFENNRTAYYKGECHDGKGIKCGEGCSGDCCGKTCISGRLREQGYIKSYRKNIPGLWKILQPRLRNARFNAALQRRAAAGQEWPGNPWCNLDTLIGIITDDDRHVEAYLTGDTIKGKNWGFKATLAGGKYLLRIEISEESHYLLQAKIFDGNLRDLGKDFIIRMMGASVQEEKLPEEAAYIVFEDRAKIHIIDIGR